GTTPSYWLHRGIALGAFVWFGKRGSPTRRPLLPRNAGTAEPVRVSPPEAVAYPSGLRVSPLPCGRTGGMGPRARHTMGYVDGEWMVLHSSVRTLRGVRTTVAFVDVSFKGI